LYHLGWGEGGNNRGTHLNRKLWVLVVVKSVQGDLFQDKKKKTGKGGEEESSLSTTPKEKYDEKKTGGRGELVQPVGNASRRAGKNQEGVLRMGGEKVGAKKWPGPPLRFTKAKNQKCGGVFFAT